MKTARISAYLTRKLQFYYKISLSLFSRIYLNFLVKLTTLRGDSVKKVKVFADIQVVLDPIHRGWVIEKLAKKIVVFWPSMQAPHLTYFPKIAPSVTHWMHYMNVPVNFLEISKAIHTVQVTHVDSVEKLNHLEKLIHAGAIPIFMSKQHAEEISNEIGYPFKKYSIVPASDLALLGKRRRILISSNYYPDGRKNENLLILLAQEYRLDTFHFIFIGKSWDHIAKSLNSAGAEVTIFSPNNPDYPAYDMQIEILRGVDCYLYLGFDEGSLGAIDAYLVGTPMIISKQGFHLEFLPRSNILLFQNYEDFKTKILATTQRNPISPDETHNWSWYRYAEQYQQVWNLLISEES